MPDTSASEKKDYSKKLTFAAFSLLTLLTLLILWGNKYLPMIDIPQHTAQLSLLRLLSDPSFPFDKIFEVNPFPSYFTQYSLGRIFSLILPDFYSMKLVVTLAVLGLPFALLTLCRSLGHSPWWALLGFPMAFNFNFHWGFVSVMLSADICIFMFAVLIAYFKDPNPKYLRAICILSILAFLSHMLMLLVAGGCAALIILFERTDVKRKLIAALSLLPVGLLIIGWRLYYSVGITAGSSSNDWKFEPSRILDLPCHLLSGVPHASSLDTVGGIVLLLLPFVFGARFHKKLGSLLPFVFVLSLYWFGPHLLAGTLYVYHRSILFIPAVLLIAVRFKPMPFAWFEPTKRLAIVLLCVVILIGFFIRIRPYDAEATQFEEIVDAMEPNRSMAYLTFDMFGEGLPGAPLFHHPAYYQVFKGGLVEMSFAMYSGRLVIFRKGHKPIIDQRFHNPEVFDWMKHGVFNYYVVRSEKDPGAMVFKEHLPNVELIKHTAKWWLYRSLAYPAWSLSPNEKQQQ